MRAAGQHDAVYYGRVPRPESLYAKSAEQRPEQSIVTRRGAVDTQRRSIVAEGRDGALLPEQH